MFAAVRFRRNWAQRNLVALACLLAFALQSFVAQTHIHPLLVSNQAVASGSVSSPVPADKNKTSQDDLSCPACQAAALVGIVLGPSGLLLLLPAASHTVAPIPEQTRAIPQAPAHVWRSRGPPHA
jgi:hypothetical protein